MFSNKFFVRLCIISFICSGIVFGSVSTVSAVTIPANIELDGYMWSSTIGWISLNCKTGGNDGPDAGTAPDDICGTGPGQSDYRVIINKNGNLSGFAWSSNIGWIHFNPAPPSYTGFPVGPGNFAANARVVGTYSLTNPDLTFEGWARACAGTISGPDLCNNMGSRTDGWDGWISLKGNNYQLRFNTGGTMIATSTPSVGTSKDGFFWGSTNVGWIVAQASMRWSEVSATLGGANCFINHGSSTCKTTLSWSFLPTNITDPTVDQNAPTVQVGINAGSASGTKTVTLSNGGNTFVAKTGSSPLISKTINASCLESDDIFSPTTSTCILNVGLKPDVTLSVSSKFVRAGEPVTLSWGVKAVPDMSFCELTGPGVPKDYMTAAIPKTFNFDVTSGLTSFSTYSLNCTTATGTDSATVNVEVIPTVIEN